MSIHIHDLEGCAPEPLAHYLKALGILRLVAEQADPDARAWWEGEKFRLATSLDRKELTSFFLETYQPTPLVAPWNKGSGFFTPNDPVHSAIEAITASRLTPYKEALAAVHQLLNRIAKADALVRAIKARTKTNKTFQTPEQLRLVKESSVLQDLLTDIAAKRTNAAKAGDGKKEQNARDEDEQVRSLTATWEPPESRPTKQEANKIKTMAVYKRLLAAADRQFKAAKDDLIPECRRTWRGKHLDWMECALVLDADGKASFPALLGTGGNDGNLDFTYKFMQRLGIVFNLSDPKAEGQKQAVAWLDLALYGIKTSGLLSGKEGKVGQFLPSGAGGANCTAGFGGQDETLLNPFDYIFMLEGAILFSAALTRRGDVRQGPRAAAPFVVSSTAAGYASAGSSDEGFRGEQWMPLWNQPSRLDEIRRVLTEGRAQIGAKAAMEPLDLARAAAQLGTARGITAFARYGFIERNGKSNLAVPLGRFAVASHTARHLDCLNDLDAWLGHLKRQSRDPHASAGLVHAERQLANALFAVAQHAEEPARWQAVLLALAAIEGVMVRGSGFAAGPVPRLRPAWALAANDGSPEFRLALACALQVEGWDRQKRPHNGVRRHWLPLNGKNERTFKIRSEGRQQRLQLDPDVVMTGRNGMADAIALVERRLLEARKTGASGLPLQAAPSASARLDDLAALLTGQADFDRTMALARALMALDRSAWAKKPPPKKSPQSESKDMPDDAWMTLRLSLLPCPLEDGRCVCADPAILRRLAAGDAANAIEIAKRRLRAANIRIAFQSAGADPEMARRWAAALAFPISKKTANIILKRITLTPKQGERP